MQFRSMRGDDDNTAMLYYSDTLCDVTRRARDERRPTMSSGRATTNFHKKCLASMTKTAATYTNNDNERMTIYYYFERLLL